MNKSLLHEQILLVLEGILQRAVTAATQAYNTATHEENIAENKYDTLGLEAAYLAHGQSERVAECEADIVAFKKLMPKTFSAKMSVALGALISLVDGNDSAQLIFLGPVGGGEKVVYEGQEVMIVTPSAPLGRALFGQMIGDEIEVSIGNKKQVFEIGTLY